MSIFWDNVRNARIGSAISFPAPGGPTSPPRVYIDPDIWNSLGDQADVISGLDLTRAIMLSGFFYDLAKRPSGKEEIED